MKNAEKIVLASASPRRKRMFEEMGIAFEVIPANIDEQMFAGEKPREYAVRAAGEKGLAVATRLVKEDKNPWIVSADTIVVLGNDVLMKPRDEQEAKSMLRRLSGKSHTVITGWAVGRHQGEWVADYTETEVTFHSLTDDQIEGYVTTGEGKDKAGSYAIQHIGSFLVDRIDGDYFNVVGLPISRVVRALIGFGALTEFLKP